MNTTKKIKMNRYNINYLLVGGSGAGVGITPIAFLVVQSNCVKLLPVSHSSAIDRLLDYVPDLVEKTNAILNKQLSNMKEEKKNDDKKEKEIKKIKEEKQELEEQVKTQEDKLIKKEEERIAKLDKMEKKQDKSKSARVRSTRKMQPQINYDYEYDETPNNDVDMDLYDLEDGESGIYDE